jgi:hypothetical protein
VEVANLIDLSSSSFFLANVIWTVHGNCWAVGEKQVPGPFIDGRIDPHGTGVNHVCNAFEIKGL